MPWTFRQVFDTHFAYVWSVLRRLGVSEADAEDRAHEVFLHGHSKLDSYDPDRPIRPWLFAFAYHVAAHHRRAQQRRKDLIEVDASHVDPAPSADQQLIREEERSLVVEALEDLEMDQRAVLVLHDWDGEPVPVIAQALGVPLNTAYSRLRLGRASLNASVKRLLKQRGLR